MAAVQEHAPVLVEGGLRKAVCGFTWPGIEYGEPPSCAYTFFEYVDAIRFGDLRRFKRIEAACVGWWFPTLDRGAGALLHFAADHGQLAAARFLVEQRGAHVNQRDGSQGWTPLHRCAHMAHYLHAPFMQLFEYLLSCGADPELLTYPPRDGNAPGLKALDLAVKKGHGWHEGEVRRQLAALIEQYSHVPKQPEYVYQGPPIGEEAQRVVQCWQALPKVYPPANWRPPPPAGFVGATGMRVHALKPWKPAGADDGSCFVRPMTNAESHMQAQLA